MTKHKHLSSKLARSFIKLMGGDAGAGALLILVAALALLAANSSAASFYHDVFHHRLQWSPIARLDTLHAWINDALMAVFFFVVGLEIKREMLDGALSSAAKRRLPVLAAAAGMVVPALIYLVAVDGDPELLRGWATPAATDIAFAVGVLGLVGKRIPPSLRLFLLTVAIVDDLGAVAIIAFFYTTQIDLSWAFAALLFLGGLTFAARRPVNTPLLTAVLAFGVWYCILHSGIHATIAGVACAFTIPLRPDREGESMLLRLEHALAPWSGYCIVPLFGLANAGVALTGMGLDAFTAPVPLGIALGLFVGKQIGIFGSIVIADKTGFAPRPQGATWPQLWGTALLCGIGFTMSLFIAALAFPVHPQLVEEAKIGVLCGSLLSAVAGYLVLRLSRPAPA